MLEVSGLTKSFATADGAVQAIDGVSFEVAEGNATRCLARAAAARPPRCAAWPASSEPTRGAIEIGGDVVSDPRRHLRAGARAPDRHGVPVLRDLAASRCVRERRLSAARAAPARRAPEIDGPVMDVLHPGGHGRWRAAPRRGSPAASSSAWRSRAPSCAGRACCCSTSPARTSTRGCASDAERTVDADPRRSASRRCSSRTTRSRRSRSPATGRGDARGHIVQEGAPARSTRGRMTFLSRDFSALPTFRRGKNRGGRRRRCRARYPRCRRTCPDGEDRSRGGYRRRYRPASGKLADSRQSPV